MFFYFYLIILIVVSGTKSPGDSPHGENHKIDCSICHTSDNWSFNKNSLFSHDITEFPLKGQHNAIDCRSCHKSLDFKKASEDCISCHEDIHQQTVGSDCKRCHEPQSWIIEDVTLMHENITFPLIGVHATGLCVDCHKNEEYLVFSPLGTLCIDCHKNDYLSAKSPDHLQQDFPTDCYLCHSLRGPDWNSGQILHSFFPLKQGHELNDCKICHTTENYNELSAECYSCHQNDYQNANNPDHDQFPLQCEICHSLNLGWKPADSKDHDSRFPIFSGKHKNEWDNCNECHTTPGNFTIFDCLNCHTKAHHQDRGNPGCYNCHPDGRE